jgi:hypothetical protein
MVWLDGDTIFFSMHGGVYRGTIGGKATVVHACKKEGADFVERYGQLAYNPKEHLLVTLRIRYAAPRYTKPATVAAVQFDEGGRIHQEIPIPSLSAPRIKTGIQDFALSSNGDYWFVNTLPGPEPTNIGIVYGQVGSDTHKEMPIDLNCNLRAVGTVPDQAIWYLLEQSAGDPKPIKTLREEYRFGALS